MPRCVIPFLCHIQNRQLHTDGQQTAGAGGGGLLTGVRSPRGLMRKFWNQTVVMGAHRWLD